MKNGHKNYNHWNVALWLFNDEGMYRHMVGLVNLSNTLDEAATWILEDLNEYYKGVTPDGAPYSFTSIRAALRHWNG